MLTSLRWILTSKWTFQVPLTTYWSSATKTAVFAIASFAPSVVNVSLHVDWGALGLDPAAVSLEAPAIAGYQPQHHFSTLDEQVEVVPAQGWLIVAQHAPPLAPTYPIDLTAAEWTTIGSNEPAVLPQPP